MSIKKIVDDLKEKKKKSTRVVAWYAHLDTVRGPFGRWFSCSENEEEAKKGQVAWKWDDCEYAAAAMSNVPELIKAYEKAVDCLKFYQKHYPGDITYVTKVLKELGEIK